MAISAIPITNRHMTMAILVAPPKFTSLMCLYAPRIIEHNAQLPTELTKKPLMITS